CNQLRCYEPRGAMSCGSPMPRGERIAKPAEWGIPMRPVFALSAGSAVDDWVAELQAGRPEPAWDRFLDRYRRLIFSAIRQYAEPADDAASAERRELVHQLLGSLSPQDRVALELHVVEELPAEQIARVLGLPNAKAVYNRVHRALGALRARLAQDGLQQADV